jgi:hypothetical protein
MTKIPVLLAGILVLILCVRVLIQLLGRDKRAVTADDFSKAREALDSILIQTTAIKRIFSNEDLEFISRSGSPYVRLLFLKERKMLALHWFRTIQKQVAYLMNIHLRLAACTPTTSPRLELTLGVQYAIFVAVSNCVLVLFWFFGPFKAKSALTYVIRVVEEFFSAFSLRLKGINPAHLGSSRESLVH